MCFNYALKKGFFNFATFDFIICTSIRVQYFFDIVRNKTSTRVNQMKTKLS